MTMFTRNDKVSDLDVEHKVHESGSARVSAPTQEVPGRRVRAAKGESGQCTAPSIISKSLKITGQLESSEDIQVDGEVEGDIRGLSVKVGSGATVTGSVYGEVVELSGTVNGKIEARQVVLTGTARMSGDVIHKDIQIDSGAYLNGSCRPEFSDAKEKKVHPLHAAASTREKEAVRKPSNGSAKAEYGAL
jgi:cytoskeletal protein CcmA (bactofilin family)